MGKRGPTAVWPGPLTRTMRTHAQHVTCAMRCPWLRCMMSFPSPLPGAPTASGRARTRSRSVPRRGGSWERPSLPPFHPLAPGACLPPARCAQHVSPVWTGAARQHHIAWSHQPSRPDLPRSAVRARRSRSSLRSGLNHLRRGMVPMLYEGHVKMPARRTRQTPLTLSEMMTLLMYCPWCHYRTFTHYMAPNVILP